MRLKPLIAVPLIAIALAGCTTQQPVPQASVTRAEEQPLFATDDEALAAAQVAYAHYLEVSDQIARDGGANPERLKGLVSESLYEEQATGYTDVQSKGLKAIGFSSYDSFTLQGTTTTSISNYVCLRLSGIQVIDSNGLDITPVSRANNLPLQLEWHVSKGRLLLEKSEVWAGQNFCL